MLLHSRYKWDVVMSIIKSATGWQARNVEDLPDEESLVLSVLGKVQKGKRMAGSLKEWLQAAKWVVLPNRLCSCS
jgi:hypothetical protein